MKKRLIKNTNKSNRDNQEVVDIMPKNRGGERPGAGRPKGAISKRSQALREMVEDAGYEPDQAIVALYEIGQRAMEAGDFPLAIDAYSKALPYVLPKLKAQELSLTEPTQKSIVLNVSPYSPEELALARDK